MEARSSFLVIPWLREAEEADKKPLLCIDEGEHS